MAASHLPLSIIIVGVGGADFEAMEELDGDTVRYQVWPVYPINLSTRKEWVTLNKQLYHCAGNGSNCFLAFFILFMVVVVFCTVCMMYRIGPISTCVVWILK